MAIPDFQSFLLPVLKEVGKQDIVTSSTVLSAVSEYFQLTEEERKERLDSGRQTRVANRIYWSLVYLQKARLLERLRRGLYKITSLGKEVLSLGREDIDIRFLERYETFRLFRQGSSKEPVEIDLTGGEIPEEVLETELTADGHSAGVEDSESADITEYPFDAERITIAPQTVHLPYLMDQIRTGTVYAPALQRGGNLWDDERQSRLIESLMLRIPLPLFYVAADKDENWSVVDGLQRITAMRRFIIDESFPLQGLEFLVSLNNLKFSALPPKFKNRINNTQLQFAVVGVNTPPEMQRNIFKRLNTGGLPLTQQEIRHALYHGPSAKLLEELAESSAFLIATTDSVDDSRMAARELILRFIAFLVRGYQDYPANGDMDAFLSETMQLMNILPDLSESRLKTTFLNMTKFPVCKYRDIETIKTKFYKAMDWAVRIFEAQAFRKSMGKDGPKSPINKALFETVGVVLSEMPDDALEVILKNKDRIAAWWVKSVGSGGPLERYVSRDAAKRSSVDERFKIFETFFVELSSK